MSDINRVDFLINKLMNLNSNNSTMHEKPVNNEQILSSGFLSRVNDVSHFVKRDFEPDHPFVDCFNDDPEALYLADVNADKISTALGMGFEYIEFNGLKLTWNKFIKSDFKKLNCNISFVPGCDAVYESHIRNWSFSNEDEYIKMLASVKGKKAFQPIINGAYQFNKTFNSKESQRFLISGFIKEEFFKKDIFHVKITNQQTKKGITLALYGDDVISLCKFRDSPKTKKGRKKPIIHWVKEYLRRTPIKTNVDGHKRGLDEFEADGYKFKISKPDFDFRDFK